MQDTGLPGMLQILQSPMGAALIPQMHARENAIMDRSAADLQAVITRSASDADENRRRNEMLPHDIAYKQATTSGVQADTTKKQNELGVFDARGGVPGAAKRDDEKDAFEQKKRDFDIFNKGLSTFRDAQSLVGMAQPGQKRATAIDIFRKAQMPDSVIKAVEGMTEEQVDAELAATVERMNQSAQKFAIQDLREDRSDGRTAATINGRLDVERIKQQTALTLGEIKKEIARINRDRPRDPKAKNVSQQLSEYHAKAADALERGDVRTANFYMNQGRDLMLLYRSQGEKPPAPDKETVISRPGADGKDKVILRERTSTVRPGAQPQTGTNNDGWGTPRMK